MEKLKGVYLITSPYFFPPLCCCGTKLKNSAEIVESKDFSVSHKHSDILNSSSALIFQRPDQWKFQGVMVKGTIQKLGRQIGLVVFKSLKKLYLSIHLYHISSRRSSKGQRTFGGS